MDIKNMRHHAPGNNTKRYVWLSSYAIAAICCICFYGLTRWQIIHFPIDYKTTIQKCSLAGFFAVLILALSKFVEITIINRSHSNYRRYNFLQLTHLISLILVVVVIASFLFSNWYTAAVSLGLISLILGFALQTPISSFIGWIYIITRNPYGIGDRIQIDVFKGDVIEIGYLDTTVWEFAGDYLTNDLPSGRLIRFPNSLVLQSPVYNYSWRDFRYIWNEIPFHVAYESDLPFVEKTIKEIAKNELGPETEKHIEDLKKLVRKSPLNEDMIKEYPFLSLRINQNTWVEVSVTYLVPPEKATQIRTEIIRKVLAELNKKGDKAMFPKSNAR
jgi:small-conductance mechanosensitive channel